MQPTTSSIEPPLYPQELAAKPQAVLVTGARGYLGANLVKRSEGRCAESRKPALCQAVEMSS